jgi:hypothetical protein
VSTLPDLHLKHMGVNLKVVEGLISLAPVSNWPRLNLEGGGARTRRLPKKGAVAQLGERLICTQEVAGSNPTSSTRVGTAV